jgi:hypothetical protein
MIFTVHAVVCAGIGVFNEGKGSRCPFKEIQMKNNRSTYATAAAAVLAVAALGTTGAAQAHVAVSVGIGLPGIAIGIPAPVYVAPQPVYYAPAPVYVQPQAYYVRPAPVVYAPPVVVAPYPVYRAGWVGPRYYGEGWRGRGEWRKPHGRGHWDRDGD